MLNFAKKCTILVYLVKFDQFFSKNFEDFGKFLVKILKNLASKTAKFGRYSFYSVII